MPKKGEQPEHTASDVLAMIRRGFYGKVKPLSDLDTIEVLPTGIEVLDHWVLPGGLPIGRSAVSELYSEPDVGKTSLGLHLLGAAQRAGGIGSLIEAENTIDKTRAPVMGANPEEIMLLDEKSMEDFILNLRLMLEKIPDGFGPNVFVYDSLAASSLEAQLASIAAKEASKRKLANVVGGKARLMSAELPVIAALIRKKRTHLCLINQTREKIGVMFGDPTTTPGGKTTKFQSALRIQLWRGKAFQRDGVDVGHAVTVKAVKSKFKRPVSKVVLRLDYERGWDNEWALVNFAKDQKVLPKDAKVSAATVKKARAELAKLPDWQAVSK